MATIAGSLLAGVSNRCIDFWTLSVARNLGFLRRPFTAFLSVDSIPGGCSLVSLTSKELLTFERGLRAVSKAVYNRESGKIWQGPRARQ